MIKKKYWLFTNNYLRCFKKRYDSYKLLELDVFDIIKESTKDYKLELKIEAKREIEDNQRNRTFYDRAQTKYRLFHEFSEAELESSIKILIFNKFEEEFKECFTED